MAFHGYQPNFKQVDLDVNTGEGVAPASGSLQFHNTSGFIQHRNGAWESFISGDYAISLHFGGVGSTQLSDTSTVGSQTPAPINDSVLQYDGSTNWNWKMISSNSSTARYAFDTVIGEEGHLFGSNLGEFDDFNISDSNGWFIKSDGGGTYSMDTPDFADNIAGDIGDLDDVNVAGIASGQWIESNGTTFIVRTAITLADLNAQLEDLTDVDGEQSTANLQMISDGDGTYSFAAMDLSTNVGGDLGDLDNVTAVASTSGQVLMADGTNFIMKALSLGDEVDGQLDALSDVDSTTNSPLTTAGLGIHSDGDGTYSFAAKDLATNVGGDLGELDNVTAVATTSGQILMADGSNFIMKAIALGDEVTGQLEDLSDVDSTTNSPLSVADLTMVSDGDGTYSFKEIVSARRSVSSISASTTGVVATVYLVDTSGGAVTFTAPAAHAAGDEIVIKDSGGSSQTNAITIATADADTIDGEASKTLESNYGSIRLTSDGTNWNRA